ncbi:hypothetical protein O6H91_Y148600 [Diphasiastrum complanatum]|nr:hypothetical protein O6H91_Y148600 [Diphasiastrum complanatum]
MLPRIAAASKHQWMRFQELHSISSSGSCSHGIPSPRVCRFQWKNGVASEGKRLSSLLIGNGRAKHSRVVGFFAAGVFAFLRCDWRLKKRFFMVDLACLLSSLDLEVSRA